MYQAVQVIMTEIRKKYVLALDQGTTSCRAVIFDKNGTAVASAQKPFRQYYPQPGWVEHDAEDIWHTQLEVLLEAVDSSGVTPEEISAVGITNQRETAVLWDRRSGRPVAPAIVWQCRRTAPIINKLVEEGLSEKIRDITGLVPDAYFSATKWQWLFDQNPELRIKAEQGELLAGTIDSWLVWKLTAGRRHITDVSNASRTMLMNIRSRQWDNRMLQLFRLPAAILPEIVPSSGIIGHVDESILTGEIPIAGIAGDQQAALFGQACYTEGMVKNTYGTGCFLLMQTGDKPVFSSSGLLTTVAWGIGDEVNYALEGSVFNAGSAIQWLRDELGIIRRSFECDQLAARVPDTGGVCFVPAFTGLGAPWWDMEARGTVTGLTRGSSREHLARAVLESIALQSNDVLAVMKKDSNYDIPVVRVDGGASVSDMLMQLQADFSQVPVDRPEITETTALGAAGFAGIATGLWADKEEFSTVRRSSKIFSPGLGEDESEKKVHCWHAAVETARFNARQQETK